MDVRYFIDKFEAIPEDKWCTGDFVNRTGQMCANGHCGVRFRGMGEGTIDSPCILTSLTEESIALYDLFKNVQLHRIDGEGAIIEDLHMHQKGYAGIVGDINNGSVQEYQQPTPKQRILAALRDIQTKEQQNKAVQEAKDVLAQLIEELV